MKIVMISVAAVTLSSSAIAQSSVTLWGRTNLTLESQQLNGASSSKLVDNGSRFGIRTLEDLGGGLKVGVNLTAGFNADTGTQQNATALFNRGSEVFLSSQVGTLRLGRFPSEAYFATADYVSLHNHDTGTSSDALYAFPVAFGRQDNKIAYRSPSLGGFTLEAATTTTESGPNRTYDIAARYSNGPLFIGSGYEKNGARQQFGLSTLYSFGALTLGGYVQRDKNAFASGSRNTVRAVAKYVIGNTELHANWGRAGNYSGVAGDSQADQYTLGVNQNLSKRTKVYAFWTKRSDSSNRLYGGDFRSVAVGLRHNF